MKTQSTRSPLYLFLRNKIVLPFMEWYTSKDLLTISLVHIVLIGFCLIFIIEPPQYLDVSVTTIRNIGYIFLPLLTTTGLFYAGLRYGFGISKRHNERKKMYPVDTDTTPKPEIHVTEFVVETIVNGEPVKKVEIHDDNIVYSGNGIPTLLVKPE